MKGNERLLHASRIGLAVGAGALVLSACGSQANAAPVQPVAAEVAVPETPPLPPDEVAPNSRHLHQAITKARGQYKKEVQHMVQQLEGDDARIVLLAHMACQQAPRERATDSFSKLAILSDMYKDQYQYDADLPDEYRPTLGGGYGGDDGTLEALCPETPQSSYR